MKKIIFSLIVLIFFSQNSFAKTKIVKGQYYEGEIKFYDLKYNLPYGKWLSLGRYTDTMGEVPNIGISCIDFVQLEDRLYKSGISICEIHTTGSYTGYVGMYLNKELNDGRYDSCTLRPEYFYTNLWTRGNSGNCFLTRHVDTNKRLNYPDDPQTTLTFFKKFIREYEVIVPKTVLLAEHFYYSSMVRDKGYSIEYAINPELFGAGETLYGDEDKSEYHRANISDYPEKEKFMINWTKESAKRHIEFETKLNARPNHKLNFKDLNLSSFVSQSSTNNVGESITKQIIELKKLYDSGALTKEEFEKAKKKILN
tara:strand:+ start:156 stop:1091 length:936 start_codon:yes stop_codon:yes gene_type:complete